jgi:hypothetical protein
MKGKKSQAEIGLERYLKELAAAERSLFLSRLVKKRGKQVLMDKDVMDREKEAAEGSRFLSRLIRVDVGSYYLDMHGVDWKEDYGSLFLFPLADLDIDEEYRGLRAIAYSEEAYLEYVARQKEEYREWTARVEAVRDAVKNGFVVIRQIERHYEEYCMWFFVYRSRLAAWLDGWTCKLRRAACGCFEALAEPWQYRIRTVYDYC